MSQTAGAVGASYTQSTDRKSTVNERNTYRSMPIDETTEGDPESELPNDKTLHLNYKDTLTAKAFNQLQRLKSRIDRQ